MTWCARMATSGGKETAVEITKALEAELGFVVNECTVRRALNSAGLKAKVKVRKLKLLPKHVLLSLEII